MKKLEIASCKRVFCVASGPSLTKEDCELIKQTGDFVFVTNTTFQLCPWADVLFAFDAKWWSHYKEEVDRVFKGRKYTSPQCVFSDVEGLQGKIETFGISGTAIIALAISAGSRDIVMLGYDCQKTSKSHWHGDHPDNFSNCSSINTWPKKFKDLAKHAETKGARVRNASRESSLTMFERVVLEDVL